MQGAADKKAKAAQETETLNEERRTRDAQTSATFARALDMASTVLKDTVKQIGDGNTHFVDARGPGLPELVSAGPMTAFTVAVYVRMPIERSDKPPRPGGPSWRFGFGKTVIVPGAVGFPELIGFVQRREHDIKIVYQEDPEDVASNIEAAEAAVKKMLQVILARNAE